MYGFSVSVVRRLLPICLKEINCRGKCNLEIMSFLLRLKIYETVGRAKPDQWCIDIQYSIGVW